jgi:hemerythrin
MDIQTEISKVKTELAPKVGRPKKETAEGRAKYSTVLQPYLIRWLKTHAAETDQTPADVLEMAVVSMRFEKERLKK